MRTVAARAAQVIVVMVATGVCASCSRSSNGPDSPRSAVSGEQSVRLEVDDRVVDLPRATLVTCVDDGRNGYRFRWTGSNMLVPRHPWDEDRHGSQIRVDFQRDPPITTSAAIRVYGHGRPVELWWPGELSGQQTAAPTLVPTGAHRYRFNGTIDGAAGTAESHYVRIEFTC